MLTYRYYQFVTFAINIEMAFIFVDILDLVVGTGSSCKDSAGTEGMAFDKALATGRLKESAVE